MHCSRMGTFRFLTYPRGSASRGSASRGSLHRKEGLQPGGLQSGGVLHPGGWGCASRGSAWEGGLPRGICINGSLSRRVCLGVCLGGLHPLSKVCLHLEVGQTPSPVNRMTHRCQNITLPQTSSAGGNHLII